LQFWIRFIFYPNILSFTSWIQPTISFVYCIVRLKTVIFLNLFVKASTYFIRGKTIMKGIFLSLKICGYYLYLSIHDHVIDLNGKLIVYRKTSTVLNKVLNLKCFPDQRAWRTLASRRRARACRCCFCIETGERIPDRSDKRTRKCKRPDDKFRVVCRSILRRDKTGNVGIARGCRNWVQVCTKIDLEGF